MIEPTRYITAILVFVLGLIISVWLQHNTEADDFLRAENAFYHSAQERIETIANRLELKMTILGAVAAFYDGSRNVDRKEFHDFVKRVNSQVEIGQSFLALEWVPVIPQSERHAYEQQARKDGFHYFSFTEKSADGRIIAARKRDQYYPVYYVEPYLGNEGVMGFDLGSNPERLDALNQARDSGTVVASRKIKLVQLTEKNAGVLLFWPIYQQGAPYNTLVTRRENIKGFVLGVMRISHIVSGALNTSVHESIQKPAGIDLYVYDNDDPRNDSLIYLHQSRSRINQTAPMLSLSQAREGTFEDYTFKVGTSSWTIVARPIDPLFSAQISSSGQNIFIASILITILLTLFLLRDARRTIEIESKVQQRTRELNAAIAVANNKEKRIRAIVENTAEAIITIDDKGLMQTVNPAAEQLFGYTSEEMLANNVAMLMPEGERESHDRYLLHSQLHATKVINQMRELYGQRKDGSIFPMQLNVSPMETGNQRMYVGIMHDITERKEAERLKSEFVSTVSHELRTPMTSIKGSISILKTGALGEMSDKAKSLLDIAVSNVDRLIRLINDILDIEKIAAGKIQYNMAPVALLSVVNESITATQEYASKHGTSYVLTDTIDDAIVFGDHDRLIQVMTNLLSNAAKYSPSDVPVEISMQHHDAYLRVSVTDKGEGIPEEFRDQIFSRFSQADSSTTRKVGGTGLGLAITKAIVEDHKGHIAFESETGQGTTFYFDLPEQMEQ
ncbi:MAG: CHASE domain-containing protein [Gammaproteobacteria bacterium]|nr:CHASE domain-containing protein [Gammaproteobacteria bacterium]